MYANEAGIFKGLEDVVSGDFLEVCEWKHCSQTLTELSCSLINCNSMQKFWGQAKKKIHEIKLLA